ncbi:MAG: hypothetical protein ACSHX5_07475 [Phycisphaerales bacterium]
MSVSGVSSKYLISPIVRCVKAMDQRDAFDAPPGAAPFHRFLQANRIADRGFDSFELSEVHVHDETPHGSNTAAMTTPLLPNLGEVIPVEPRPKVSLNETRHYQQMVPATGRVLDLYA